jgi:hypothetical protein
MCQQILYETSFYVFAVANMATMRNFEIISCKFDAVDIMQKLHHGIFKFTGLAVWTETFGISSGVKFFPELLIISCN